MQRTSVKLSSAVKNKIWINKWLNWEFSYFFNTALKSWPNPILFQGLEKRFHNSILFPYLAIPREETSIKSDLKQARKLQALFQDGVPLTSCSSCSMTWTAWWRMVSLVWGLSWFMWIWTMWPSSLKASLMSRTLRRSRALLAILRSFSRFSRSSAGRSSSSLFAPTLRSTT